MGDRPSERRACKTDKTVKMDRPTRKKGSAFGDTLNINKTGCGGQRARCENREEQGKVSECFEATTDIQLVGGRR